MRIGDVLRLKTIQTFWDKKNSATFKLEKGRVAVCLLLGYEMADETAEGHKPLDLTAAMLRLGWIPDPSLNLSTGAEKDGD